MRGLGSQSSSSGVDGLRWSAARWVAVLCVFSSAGCAGSLRAASEFDGESAHQRVQPEQVSEIAGLPYEHEVLGEATTHCDLIEGTRTLQKEWLSDVDCSVTRLTRALKERASWVGADKLVGKVCHSRPPTADDGPRTTRIWCRATLARASDDASWRGDRDVLADETPWHSASEGWRVRVRFTPSKKVAWRPARRPDLVNEVAVMPLSHIRIGDVVTHCDRGCSEAAVRAGVREAAGRMGAHSVVEVHCTARGEGFECTGIAASYQIDPELDPSAG